MNYLLHFSFGFYMSNEHLIVYSSYIAFSLTLPIFPAAAFVAEKLVQWKYISEPVSDSSLITANPQLFLLYMKMTRSDGNFLAIWILEVTSCILSVAV